MRKVTAALALAWVLTACGDPTGPPEDLPDGWAAVAAGDYHTCALTVEGEAYCWGSNQFGQLGRDDLELSAWPRRVQSDALFVSLSSGFAHTCGITAGGEAYCWGLGRFGQLGAGSRPEVGLPARVEGPHLLRDISAGYAHTCGITMEGEAVCWGDNADGQLGIGSTEPSSSPTLVAGGGLRLFSVSAGLTHTCGAAWNGLSYCWGDNRRAQLGIASFEPTTSPRVVHTRETFVQVTAGSETTCGVTLSGAPYCWGSNDAGKLGGPDVDLSGNPVPVSSPTAFNGISASGAWHVCGVSWAGTAYCWGRGGDGQLGDGSLANSVVPVAADSDRRFLSVSTGLGHTCGVTVEGGIYCWGQGQTGQLGNGAFEDRTTPTFVGEAGNPGPDSAT